MNMWVTLGTIWDHLHQDGGFREAERGCASAEEEHAFKHRLESILTLSPLESIFLGLRFSALHLSCPISARLTDITF